MACLNKFWVVAMTFSTQEKDFNSLFLGKKNSVLLLQSIGANCKDRKCHCTLKSSRIKPWTFTEALDCFSVLLHYDVAEYDTWYFSCIELQEYNNSKNLTQKVNGMNCGRSMVISVTLLKQSCSFCFQGRDNTRMPLSASLTQWIQQSDNLQKTNKKTQLETIL